MRWSQPFTDFPASANFRIAFKYSGPDFLSRRNSDEQMQLPVRVLARLGCFLVAVVLIAIS